MAIDESHAHFPNIEQAGRFQEIFNQQNEHIRYINQDKIEGRK